MHVGVGVVGTGLSYGNKILEILNSLLSPDLGLFFHILQRCPFSSNLFRVLNIMVKLDIVRSSISDLVKSQPLVAVFVGGTSGIGEFTVQALAATHGNKGKGLRVYIVGRNASAAEKTIAECRVICPNGQFIFVKAQDLSLLNDVDRVCEEIMQLERNEKSDSGAASIDILVMSQHYFPLSFEPRLGMLSPAFHSTFQSLRHPLFNFSIYPA